MIQIWYVCGGETIQFRRDDWWTYNRKICFIILDNCTCCGRSYLLLYKCNESLSRINMNIYHFTIYFLPNSRTPCLLTTIFKNMGKNNRKYFLLWVSIQGGKLTWNGKAHLLCNPQFWVWVKKSIFDFERKMSPHEPTP